ncbi:MAG: conserved phage C-terminal domain-containing protein [Atopobiaceae bacterium]|nr:conserved phage C-terminal domain-containing protein [Atopobiaceae bacterium]
MKISIQEDMYEVMEQLPQDQGAELAKALIEFGFEGKEPEPCKDTWYFVFLAFKGRIEMSAKRSADGAEAISRRWSKSKDTDRSDVGTNDRSDVGTNDTENESESESEKEKEQWRAQVRAASEAFVSHLNAACGTDYRADTEDTLKRVSGRLKDSYTVDDLCAVADGMAAEWLHDRRMRGYLRPKTLLAKANFESYLQRVRSIGTRAAPGLSAYDQAGLVEVVGGVA